MAEPSAPTSQPEQDNSAEPTEARVRIRIDSVEPSGPISVKGRAKIDGPLSTATPVGSSSSAPGSSTPAPAGNLPGSATPVGSTPPPETSAPTGQTPGQNPDSPPPAGDEPAGPPGGPSSEPAPALNPQPAARPAGQSPYDDENLGDNQPGSQEPAADTEPGNADQPGTDEPGADNRPGAALEPPGGRSAQPNSDSQQPTSSDTASSDGAGNRPDLAATPAQPYDRPGHADTPGNAPSAPPGQPDKKAAPGGEDLGKAEEAAGRHDSQAGDTSPDDEEASFYKALEKQAGKGWRRWMFTKRRAAAGGGIIGTIIALVAFFSFTAGPLQFVHIAKLMEQFHFASLEDQSDNRTYRLIRDYRYAKMGRIENTRLGVFGNHYANKIESRFNEVGIESSYTKLFGFRDGLIIDPEKLPADSPFHDPKTNFGIEPQTDVKGLKGKQFFIPTDKLNYRENTALSRAAADSAGISKKFAWISARIMGERAGVTWHPIKKLDNKILKTAEDIFLKKYQAETIDNGVTEDLSLSDKPTTGADATDAEKVTAANHAAEASAATYATRDAGKATGEQVLAGDDNAVPKFTQRLSFKLGAGGAGAAGIACMARGLAENINALKTTRVILPLIRYGVQFMALGGQVMTGQGVDLQQLGFFSQFLSGKNEAGQNTSAFDAASIVSENGQGQNGVAPPDTLKDIDGGNPLEFFITDKANTILGPVCSKVGNAVQISISFLGGPIATVATLGLGQLVGKPIMNTVAHWFAHDAINAFAKGSDAGANIDYGSALAANAQADSAGGRVLSNGEVAELNSTENSYYQQAYNRQSVAYKLFDPYDQRTAISKLIDAGSPSLSDNIAKMGAAFLNVGHMFGSIGQIFAPRAQAAATPYDYGFPIIGFSPSEMNNRLVANPYQNADQVVNSILPAHPSYIKRAQQCFGVTIDPTTYDITSWGGNGDVPAYKNNGSTPGMESSSCTDKSNGWLQLRFYIFDSQTAESASCYEGDDTACAQVGFGGSETPPTTTNDSAATTTGTLPTGSAADLAKQLLPYLSKGAIRCAPQNGNDIGCSDIINTANGTSLGGYCDVNALNANLLGMLLELAKMGHSFTLSALCSDHSTNDGLAGHRGGRAVDFNTIDGVFMGPDDVAWTQTKINAAAKLDQDIASFMPKSTGFGQVGQNSNGVTCHSNAQFGFLNGFSTFGDTCNHQHVQVED